MLGRYRKKWEEVWENVLGCGGSDEVLGEMCWGVEGR